MRDNDFGMIRIRAFGKYAIKISDAKTFFETVVGTRGLTEKNDILGQLRSTIVSRLSDAIAEAKIPALDLASKYDELAGVALEKMQPDFKSFGLDLSRFFIENISLPEEVEAAIDQRTKLGVLGDRLGQYTQMQAAESIKVAAANPGGLGGVGAGLGAGMAIGNAMTGAFNQGNASSAAAPPPPPPGAPPAPSASPRWSLAIDGKTYGPYTDDALRTMVQNGQVAPTTQAWRPGAAGWAAVSEFPELGLGSNMMPPPPPPPPK